MKRRFISVLAIILCLGLLGPMWVMAEEEDEEEEEDPVAVVTIIPAEGEQAELGVADESILIEADGLKFKDLNKNDQLDPYEDWRLGTEERVADLLSRTAFGAMELPVGIVTAILGAPYLIYLLVRRYREDHA